MRRPAIRRAASVDAAQCALFAEPLPACQYAVRGPDGECFDVARWRRRWRRQRHVGKKGKGGAQQAAAGRGQTARSPNELVAEIDGALSTAEADELARRHGLERIESQNFPLIGGTIGLFRIIDRRPVDMVRREFAADGSVRSVQFNFRYLLQDRRSPRPRATPRNMPSRSFGCRRHMRSSAA